jgi:voltage-gated potassium channel
MKQKSKSTEILDRVVYFLIIASIVGIVAETHDISDNARYLLGLFETVTYIAFSVEYVYRILQARKGLGVQSYALSFFGIIDLLAILPFFLPFIIAVDARAIRVLRLLRLVNVIKIGRHNRAINTLIKVIRSVRTEVAVTLFASIVVVVFAGILMYYAEHQTQPEVFTNMSQSIWWAVATLTTIGYGDIYPVTALGKIIASSLAFVGVGLVAIPAGLISAAYVDEINSQKK